MFSRLHELDNRSSAEWLSDLSCVLYECTTSFQVVFLSKNILDLIGIARESFIGNDLLWEQSVPPKDKSLLRDGITGLRLERAGSLIHRFIDVDGLSLWVCNRMQLVELDGVEAVRGCVVPLGPQPKAFGLDPSVGSQFAHKLANQFQIQGMILSSLRRSFPNVKDMELLQQTLDRTVELARAFSQYNQLPARVDGLRVLDLLAPVLGSYKAVVKQKGIAFKEEIDPALEEMVLYGDALYLDLALRYVFQNALEATDKNGEVAIVGSARLNGRHPTVTIRIEDSGRGMKEAELVSASTLYFSTKKNHDGVGLSLAQRFVELHDGSLRVSSIPGKGTKVEIILPARRSDLNGKVSRERL
jgi:signal transduction histidine kinase